MERKTQSGYLVLADISGYTSFVAQTEIEHADLAISLLLEAVIEKLAELLTISKLEGDAVCTYVEDSKLAEGERLLALIDETYLAFRDKVEALYVNATCSCRACQAIPTLDLKFMAHHGEYLVQQIAGIKDLMGSDVNLVHRLMKNHVTENTGWRGYALFTGQCLEQMQIGKEIFMQQAETYEHLGEVQIFVVDLQKRYAERGESRRYTQI